MQFFIALWKDQVNMWLDTMGKEKKIIITSVQAR